VPPEYLPWKDKKWWTSQADYSTFSYVYLDMCARFGEIIKTNFLRHKFPSHFLGYWDSNFSEQKKFPSGHSPKHPWMLSGHKSLHNHLHAFINSLLCFLLHANYVYATVYKLPHWRMKIGMKITELCHWLSSPEMRPSMQLQMSLLWKKNVVLQECVTM